MILKIIIAIIVFLGVVLVFKGSKLSNKKKIFIALTSIVLVLLAIIYEYQEEQQTKNINQIIASFSQNKTIQCSEYQVNNKSFELNLGTLSFIATLPNLKGVIVDIKTCDGY